MNESILNRKIELKPHIPKSDECTCLICQGIGYVLTNEKWLTQCANCYGKGVVSKCKYCGEPMVKRAPYSYSYKCNNDNCIEKERKELEEKVTQDELNRYNKATKYTFKTCPKEYMGMLYSEEYGYDEGYFNDIDELIGYCENEDIPVPDYCWSTEQINMSMDADSIIENACEELFEDAESHIDNSDRKELQEFLNKWCAKQTATTTYGVYYKYAIKVEE